MVNKVTFVGFRVGDRPNRHPLDPPLLRPLPSLLGPKASWATPFSARLQKPVIIWVMPVVSGKSLHVGCK